MIVLRPVSQQDADYLEKHSISRGICGKMPDQTEWTTAVVTKEKPDIPLAIGGISMINHTTAWAWIDMSHEAGKHIIGVYRIIRNWLDDTVKQKGIKRLQCYVERDFYEAHHLVRHLGFDYEFTMENFVDGHPADMYRKLYISKE